MELKQPFGPPIFLLCPADVLSYFGLPQKQILRQGFKCKLLIWEVNETSVVEWEKETGKRRKPMKGVTEFLGTLGDSGEQEPWIYSPAPSYQWGEGCGVSIHPLP